jgi:glucose-6-phosphate isomerase
MEVIFKGVERIYQSPIASFFEEKKNALNSCYENPNYGFLKMENVIESAITDCHEIHKKFSHKTQFIQVGIGGSALGPEMLISSLKKSDTQFTFVNNIDPDRLFEQLKDLKPESSLFYIVSKSGSTAETMANFSIICQWLFDHGVKKEDINQYFVFATDPVKGDLRELAQLFKVECLDIPENIGGRYSVLTSVGLLPALFGGLNLNELFDGYKQAKKVIFESAENSLFQSCFYLEKAFEKGINQTVIMPYSSKLRQLSDWFVQLWAESLGKQLDLNNKIVETGLTPIASYGATDQHSQVQLFMEGPRDKIILIIEVESFNHDFKLENNFDQKALSKLSPFSLATLLKAELEGNKEALTEKNRPFLSFKIDRINEKEIAKLVFYLETLTVLIGDYLKIDPLNQPGVEAGKRYAHDWLQQNFNKNS